MAVVQVQADERFEAACFSAQAGPATGSGHLCEGGVICATWVPCATDFEDF